VVVFKCEVGMQEELSTIYEADYGQEALDLVLRQQDTSTTTSRSNTIVQFYANHDQLPGPVSSI